MNIGRGIMNNTNQIQLLDEKEFNKHMNFSEDQIEILKNFICKGLTDSELKIFLMACVKTQLDPFMRQIYAVKRKQRKNDGSYEEMMTIQTGIDGYRLIAERTEQYAPGPEPSYSHAEDGSLLSATSYVKKLTKDGTWHTVSASAYLEEFIQTSFDKQTQKRKPSGLWATMPRTMLAKCAEAQALRKAFPAVMSGVYTKEEMDQADQMIVEYHVKEEDKPKKISQIEADALGQLLDQCDKKYKDWIGENLSKNFNISNLNEIPLDMHDKIKQQIISRKTKYQAKLQEEGQDIEYASKQTM